MRLYMVFLISLLVAVTSASYYSSLCSGHSTLTYDVSSNEYTIYSHDEYVLNINYNSNYRRCFDIYTNDTNYVIKLEEEDFDLEDFGCTFDYLQIFFASMDSADLIAAEGVWCGGSGPGTKYSDGNHMFLYFVTDFASESRGFEFRISSIHEDDVPIQLSTGAIVGIVFGVLALIAIVGVIVVCVLIQKKKPGNVHPTGQPGGAAPANRNVVVASSMNTMYNRQMVGGHMSSPQYQQQPPLYQNYQMRPTVQPFGAPLPPQQPAHDDPAYPPPAAIYNPQPSHQQPGVPPPAYKQNP